MRKLTLMCSIMVLMLTAAIARASVIDAPHNETNGIKCTSCHSYSLWWTYSPTVQNVTPGQATIFNAVCMTCHDGSSGTKPLAWTHSSEAMGSNHYGTWGVGCMDCHDPHYQSQLTYVGSATEPYLVTGSMSAVSYNSGLGQTTITYAVPPANLNPLWPAVGATATDPDWANKSVSNPGRGLILVHDKTKNLNTFDIVSATDTEVVVRGLLPIEAITTTYTDPLTHVKNSATCNTFGLIYGQLIKEKISYTDRTDPLHPIVVANAKPVKFFDPTAGFVEAGGTTTGICQVCHSKTSHFTKSGDLPGSTDSHKDRIAVNCTTCHKHAAGFKKNGHAETSFGWDGNCATCHNPGTPTPTVDIVATIHGNSCGMCHVETQGGGTRKDGDPANGIDGSAIGATNASTCVSCHITKLALTSGTIHHTSAHGYAAAGTCTQCHANAIGKLAADHSSMIHQNNDCILCHGAAAGTTAGAPFDAADPKVHDACITCHNNNGSLKAAYGSASAMPAGGSANNDGGGDCKACHGEYFASHTNVNHSNRVIDSANCNHCHLTASIVGTTTGVPVNPLDPKIHDACSTCHNANGSLKPLYGKASAMPAGGGACEACHGNYFVLHTNADHTNRVKGTANCNTCHPTSAIVGTAMGIPVSLSDNKVHDACSTCHDSNGSLKAGYGKAPAMAAGGGDCNACHGAYFASHTNANHLSRVATSANCDSCHTATAGTSTTVPLSLAVDKVHNDCATCHDVTTGALRTAYGKATSMPVGGGSCEACHGTYFTSHGHGHSIPTVPICLNCHVAAAAPYIATDEAHHPKGCQTCHSALNGLLINAAIGQSAGATCQTCHGGKFNDHGHSHNMTTVALCVSCHKTATSAPYAAAGQTHAAKGCQTCHSAIDGKLTGIAIGQVKGADCQSCHGGKFNDHLFSHTDLVKVNTASIPAVANCINCHSAINAPFVATGQAHNRLGCMTCHSSVNGSLIDSASGKDAGGECIDCHTAFFEGHSHSHTVAVQPTDLGQKAPGTLCSTCHIGTIYVVHTGGCAACHNVDQLTGKDATEKVADIIVAGRGNANPVACLACHWNKQSPATHGGHPVTTFAWDSTTIATCGAAACHDSAGNVNVTLSVHDNNCSLCHTNPDLNDFTRKAGTKGDGSAIGATKTNTCAFCHNSTTYPKGAIHHDTPNAVNGNCSSCHSGSTYAGNHLALIVMSDNCVACHSGAEGTATGAPVDPVNNKIHHACTTCHETSGVLKSAYGKASAMPDGGSGSNNGGGTCEACHGVYFGSHVNANHLSKVTESINCKDCHLSASIVGTITGIPVDLNNNKVHDACSTCHQTNGSLKAAYGTALLMTTTGGACEACHGAYFTGHLNANHSDFVAGTANCNTSACHPATAGTATGIPLSSTDNKVHDTCSTCHNTNGSLLPASGTAIAMKAGGATCNDCHGAYFINHSNANHSSRVATSTSCGSCHTATAGTATTVPLSSTDNKLHHACASCHNATTGALLAGFGKAPDMASPGGTCTACHTTAYFAGHSHAHTMGTVSLCTSCHTNSTAPYVTGVQAHSTHLTCQSCHDSSTGLLTGSAIGKSTGATCQTCHPAKFNDHGHAHTMSTVALCTNCHAATTAPYVVDVKVHARLGCQTCHSPSTGALTSIAAGKTSGASCQTCHSGKFDDHAYSHSNLVKINSLTTPTTSNCVGCHNATSAPFVGNSQIHARFGCQTCHNSSTGALTGSAIGKTTGGECVTCHGGDFTGHTVHNSITHDVLMQATDLSGGVACDTCHGETGTAFKKFYPNAWTGSTGIYALHTLGCTTCHNSTRTTNVNTDKNYTSVNNVIMTGAAVGCLDCHYDRRNSHGAHGEGDGSFAWAGNCESCHGITGISPAAPKGEVIAGVHSNTCGKCHLGGAGGAALIGSAAKAVKGAKPHVCTECHTGYFDNHLHQATHDIAMRATDLSNNGVTPCNECHRRGGTSTGNPLFTSDWAGIDGVLALHQSSCVLCHSSSRTTNVNSQYGSVANVILLGSNIGCLDCHSNRYNLHASHGNTDFAWAGNCSDCHSGVNIVINVHKAKCDACHLDGNGGGTKRAGSDGSSLLAVPLANPRTATCLTCHPVATYPTGGIHHNSRTAATNDCLTCHGVGVHKPDHRTNVIGVAPCTNCHTATAGTITGLPVDMNNGAVHDSCRTCHTFNPTTFAGVLAAPTGVRGVTVMQAGTCTTCHTSYLTMHHNNNHSLIGECEYCHRDPRNMAGGTNFQETTPAGGIPTHLPCEECHVTPKATTGWAGNQMTILAFNEGSSHSTTNYATDFTRTTAHSSGHVIGNTVGKINNWGICFSCHDGTTATRVNTFHAKPTAVATTNTSCGATGTSAFAPGREARNTMGNFDFFASTFRPASTRPGGSGSCNQTGDWTGAVKYGSTDFTLTGLGDTTIPDPWSTSTVALPIFAAQAKNTTVTPGADNVKVLSAVWNGTNLLVNATNTNGCAALTAAYNGSNQTFTGTDVCIATFATTVHYTSTVPNLNVTTTNVSGLSVYGYRINDLTVVADGHYEGDGRFIWESKCQSCHGVGSGSILAQKGEIIGGVHASQCGLCHRGGVGGGDRIGSAAISTNQPAPHKCTDCHVTYFDGHTRGQGSNHLLLMRANDLSGAAQLAPLPGKACNECHRRGGTSSANPLFTNSWSGTDGILALHKAGCGECHNSTRTSNVGAGYASVYDVLMTGTQVGCLDCHSGRVNQHEAHFEGDESMAWVSSCQTCHGIGGSSPAAPKGEIIAGVHAGTSGGCGLCHQAGVGGALLIGSAQNANLAPRPHFCTDCHSGYFNLHVHPHTDVLMRSSDLSGGSACNTCHKVGGSDPENTLFVNEWSGAYGISALHQLGCGECHSSTRTTNMGAGYTSVMDVIARGTTVSCRDCHENRIASHGRHLEDGTSLSWVASCQTCHGAASLSLDAQHGNIFGDIHADCGVCHLGGVGGGVLQGSAAKATVGIKPHPCTECHTGYFDGHNHRNFHYLSMKDTDHLTDLNNTACNVCHRRGGTTSANPLFTNEWTDTTDPATEGILSLHRRSCDLCHLSTRTSSVAAGHTSVQDVILTGGEDIGCLDCHANKTGSHIGHSATDFATAGNCATCHTSTLIVDDIHKKTCGSCHVASGGGGTLRAGSNGSALLASSSGLHLTATCLTCHPIATYPSGGIHHDTTTAASNNCVSCHTATNHTTMIVGTGTVCITCHASTVGATSGAPVSVSDGKVHDSCRTCHTFDANLKGVLVTVTAPFKRGVTVMFAGGTGTNDGGGLCTVCHTATTGVIHHTSNAHTLIGECEFCHTDPRNKAGGTTFQETAPAGGIPKHLPCEECHVTPKRGATLNGWAGGQMTILAFNEGSSHSTTNYATDFTKTTAHSGGHVIANTVGKINNWGICFSCHGNTPASTAVAVTHFHAKPTAVATTNSSCGASGTSAFAPGREARNTIGNFDFFASTFRPASTRPGGSGSCNQVGDWTGASKYGSTIFTATDTVAIPDPWSANTNNLPLFAAQTQLTAVSASADDVKVTGAVWNGTNLVVTATNTSGCAALTATYPTTPTASTAAFTGVGTCTATFATSVLYSSSLPTLNVTTSNPDGVNVTGYRITAVPSKGTISFSSATYSGAENSGTVTITATRLGGSAGAVGVTYATSPGSATADVDYTTTTGTLSWTDGESGNKTFTIPLLDDAIVEGSETVNLSLSAVTGGATLGTPNAAVLTITDDDNYGVIALSAPTYSVGEAGSTATITATRSGGSTGVVGVTYATSNGTATAGADYTAASSTLSWAAGDSASKTFTVAITDDTALESSETFNVALSLPTGGASLGTQTTAVVTITDNDTAIVFSAPTYSVGEAGPTVTITASRTGSSTAAVGVSYATSDGTALAGADYTAASGTLSWAAGDLANKTFTVPTINDTAVEGSETFNVTLLSPTGVGANLGAQSSAVVTITDNDNYGAIALSAATYSVSEAGPTVTITATRTGGSSGAVGVSYATTDGTATDGLDYTGVASTLSWADGDAVSKTFTVAITDDTLVEPNETFNVALSSPTGGASLGAVSSAIVTITNNDSYGAIALSAATYSVSEAGGTVTITATRSGGSSGEVGISYATADGSATAGADYSSASSTLTWADGDTAPKTFTVDILEDTTPEGTETFNLALSTPSGGATLGAPGSAVVSILDNDAVIALSAATYSVNETGGTATITASRTAGSVGVVGVTFATSDGTAVAAVDYSAVSSTLSWADGDMANKTFTVPIIDNAVKAGDVIFNVTLSEPSGGAIVGTQSIAPVTIIDDESQNGVIALAAATYSVSEAGGTVTITATRSGGTAGEVGITYNTTNGTATAGSDYTAANSTLTWADGDTANKTFTVAITNDSLAETDENFTVGLSTPTGGAVLGTPSAAVVTIIDNDKVTVGSDFSTTNVTNATGTAMTAISGTYAVGGTAGTNRLLVVVAQYEAAATANTSTFTSGTWGNQTLTSLTVNGSATLRNRIWIGFMKEAQIAAATSTTLSLNIANGTNPTAYVVKAAWFSGVNQGATPINHFVNGGSDTGATPHNFGATALNVINGGLAYYFETANLGVTYTPPTGYTEKYDANDPGGTANFVLTAGSKPITTTGTENPNITQSTAMRYAVTGISIQP